MVAFNPVRWIKAEYAGDLSEEERTKLMRKRLFLTLGVAIVAIAAILGLWWLLVGSHYVSTDDAYVDASSAQITPLTSGRVESVPVHDTQAVKRGDILVVIDPEDAKLHVDQASAAYGMTVRKVETYFAAVEARRADFARTKLDYDRRVGLVKSGAVSGEELTAVTNNYASAKAGLDAALALTHGTNVRNHPEVLAAKAALDTAKLNLERTVIRAPLDGIVTQRQVQVGQMAAADYPIMAVVPITEVYVEANFKEGQLGKVHAGQPAAMTCDLYGSSVKFHGRVMGIGGGTGSAFAVIPAQNATGNWIKVVQRVPVRIALDPAELAKHPLRVGLSISVTVDLSE